MVTFKERNLWDVCRNELLQLIVICPLHILRIQNTHRTENSGTHSPENVSS